MPRLSLVTLKARLSLPKILGLLRPFFQKEKDFKAFDAICAEFSLQVKVHPENGPT